VTEAISVLVVDDDPDVRDLLEDYLSEQGYEVLPAESATAARKLLATRTPSVVLLDVGLPGEDGLSLARHIRERLDIGIIMISGAGETVDRIVGLEVGADDYVAKPFDPRELKARLKCVLRRYQRPRPPPEGLPLSGHPGVAAAPETRRVCAGRCLLDLDSRQLFDQDGVEIPLTRMEFDLLEVLVQRPNRPLTRDQLLNLTQNPDWDPFDRSVDIRIARLRRKVEPDPDKTQCIRTLRGLGAICMFPCGREERGSTPCR
jgi:two-component system phosphate regulon response regulator OmpR